MNFNQNILSENQQIQLKILKEKEVKLFIKREDKIHPFVSGNKFRKLKYNLAEAKNQQQKIFNVLIFSYLKHKQSGLFK